MSIAYVNGAFIEQEKASISIMDRGLLFADSVYEIIPIYNKHLFALDSHLKRLNNSLTAINLPLDTSTIPSLLATLINKNQLKNGSAYLQITRGIEPIRKLSPQVNPTPSLIAFLVPTIPTPYDRLKQGFSAVTVKDIRWTHCDIKTTALIANVLLQATAEKESVDFAILTRAGYALEGTNNNLIVVKDEKIYTPPKACDNLPGITREIILSLAKKNQIAAYEEAIPLSLLKTADEIWLTSSTKEILPVSELNHQTVGKQKHYPLWEKIYDVFQKNKLHS